jgi:UDPglucose 6-dehydrogenase
MRIAMIGTGYVGLISGSCLADLGHEVTCVDTDADKIARLSRGEVPIYEPGLEALLARTLASGRLGFTADLALAVAGAEAVFIAVGTPARHGDGHADLRFVMTAAEEIGRALTGPAVIVTKSTVPVGTARKVDKAIRRVNPGAAFDLCANPEFLREGAAIADFMQPDRVVIGVDAPRARVVMEALYAPLALQGHPVLFTDLESAELIKYAANAFLATKITFINEIAALSERLGADVRAVAEGMGLDARIGARFLEAGPGYGGSCFPKDTMALARMGQESQAPVQIVEAVIRANDAVKQRMISKIAGLLGGDVSGKAIAVLGVTFKAGTDDMRDAPALTILPALQAAGAHLRVTDPQGQEEAALLLPGVTWCDTAYDAAMGAELVVVLTEWAAFRGLDLDRLARSMATPRMADLRNLYDRDAALAAGFTAYVGVGR